MSCDLFETILIANCPPYNRESVQQVIFFVLLSTHFTTLFSFFLWAKSNQLFVKSGLMTDDRRRRSAMKSPTELRSASAAVVMKSVVVPYILAGKVPKATVLC